MISSVSGSSGRVRKFQAGTVTLSPWFCRKLRYVPRLVPKKIRLPFTFFLALRYLAPKRTFLSIITLISIVGVVLGISVLIIVLSVMTGFEKELQRKVLGFEPHIYIAGDEVMYDWEEILAKVKKIPGVVAAAPFAYGKAVVKFNNRQEVPTLRGIDPELEKSVIDFKQFVVSGMLDLDGDDCVIGSELAARLGVAVGDAIEVYSPHDLGAIQQALNDAQNSANNKTALDKVRELTLPQDLTVKGIFSSGRYAFDSEFVIVPMHIMQEAYTLGNGVHGIEIKTSNALTAGKVRDEINLILDPRYRASTWIDRNSELFDAIKVEKVTMFFVLMFVVIVAAFGIMSTLITTTVQKTREIGLLKAIGAHTSQIRGIFFAQGMIVGFFGTLIGLGCGILAVQHRNELRDLLSDTFHIPIFPASVYQFSQIPAEIVPQDIVVICVSGFLLCAIAAMIPAYFAARLDPVKALRHE
jgi:lipoprotein-releasing system permease protein